MANYRDTTADAAISLADRDDDKIKFARQKREVQAHMRHIADARPRTQVWHDYDAPKASPSAANPLQSLMAAFDI